MKFFEITTRRVFPCNDDVNDEEYIGMLTDVFMRDNAIEVIQGSIQFKVNKVETPVRRLSEDDE